MEGGEMGDRVECCATRLVNEDPLVRDRCHHIVLDEFINETAGTPLVETGSSALIGAVSAAE
jgi:hypothetical protein